MRVYAYLLAMFSTLSLLSIGGGNTVLPQMHLEAVKGQHWLTDSQFAGIFSISQAAPGPSILIVTLVGYAAGLTVGGVSGGILGGIAATAAMIIPAAALVFVLTRFWQKAQKSRLRHAVEKGFAPLTVGLILATSLVMSRAADRLARLSAHRSLHADLRLHQDQSTDHGGRRCIDRVSRRGLIADPAGSG